MAEVIWQYLSSSLLRPQFSGPKRMAIWLAAICGRISATLFAGFFEDALTTPAGGRADDDGERCEGLLWGGDVRSMLSMRWTALWVAILAIVSYSGMLSRDDNESGNPHVPGNPSGSPDVFGNLGLNKDDGEMVEQRGVDMHKNLKISLIIPVTGY